MRLPAWYGIVVGTLIVMQWIFFLATGSVPELQRTPWAIAFHIAAEMTLASTLIAGGVGTLQGKPWGRPVLLLALGMAIYSEINSPGYFAQLSQWALVGMFAVLLLGAAWSALVLLSNTERRIMDDRIA